MVTVMVFVAAISCSPKGYKGTAGACSCDKGYQGYVLYSYELNLPTGCTGQWNLNCIEHPCHDFMMSQIPPYSILPPQHACFCALIAKSGPQIISLVLVLLFVEIQCTVPTFPKGIEGGIVSGSSITACKSGSKLGECDRE